MGLDDDWITEICAEGGSAFALKGGERVFDRRSAFQHVEVFATETYGKLMTIDGCTMVSTRENFLYHEMMSHPVLFMHPAPRRVAIVGGGDCGTLREVLKHPEVERATQIDIDRVVTEASEIHFPELCASNGDPRAELLYADGIQWIGDAAPGSLDVIVVDSTDPVGPGEVLFTPDFHAACLRALGPQGLLVQQSESPLIHMAILERLHRSLKGAGFAAARTLFFPQPIYPTGWWSATIGIRDADGGHFREADARAATFDTRYYNADIHRAAFAEPEFFRRARGGWWDEVTPA